MLLLLPSYYRHVSLNVLFNFGFEFCKIGYSTIYRIVQLGFLLNILLVHIALIHLFRHWKLLQCMILPYLYTHSSTNIHMGCFHPLMNISVHFSSFMYARTSLKCICGTVIRQKIHTFKFTRQCPQRC